MLSSGVVLLGLAAGVVAPGATGEGVVYSLAATAHHPRNSEGSFATLRSGRIIYYYSQFSEGDSDFSPCGIAQMHSDDGGRTWSEPAPLFTPEPGAMEMSVSLLRLASDRLACFTVIKRNKVDCCPYVRISSDDGATWSAPRRVIDAPGYFVLNNDRVIQTSKGRLVMPLGWHRLSPQAAGAYEGIDLRAVALWYYSDDEGETWKEADTWWALPAVTRTGLQEPGVVELADGSLFSWARTDQGCQYGMRSRDQGVTWSAPEPLALRSPAAPASIKRLPGSADLLAVFVDHSGQFPFELTEHTYSDRTPLVAAVSSDNGQTWRVRQVLGADPRRDYCYAAIHFTPDAALFAYFAASRDPAQPSTMQLQRVALAELTAPEDPLAIQAKSVLRDVMGVEESWIKIHAAEALVAAGETEFVREQMRQLAPQSGKLVYRVGIQRVLANTAGTLSERRASVAEVERIFLQPASPDRSQALETLCKLHHRVSGPALAAARELARSEAAFRALADTMPQMVFAADASGHVDYFNRQWYEYTGLPEGSVGYENWKHVHTEEGLRRATEVWPEAVRSGRVYELEYLLRRRDGEYRWHLGRAVPVRDEGGRIRVRATTEGTPPSSSTETRASPMPSCVITSSVEKAGLGRNVSAATLTAFWSRGV